MGIEVVKSEKKDEAGTYFEVRVGPENHVCQVVRKFYWFADPDAEKYQDSKDQAFWKAKSFEEGAAAAIDVTSGLVARFISVPR